MTNSQLDTTNESQEVSPFPAGDQKAHINRRAQRHSKHKTEKNNMKDPQTKYRLGTVSTIFTGGLLKTGLTAPTSPLIQIWIKPNLVILYQKKTCGRPWADPQNSVSWSSQRFFSHQRISQRTVRTP